MPTQLFIGEENSLSVPSDLQDGPNVTITNPKNIFNFEHHGVCSLPQKFRLGIAKHHASDDAFPPAGVVVVASAAIVLTNLGDRTARWARV